MEQITTQIINEWGKLEKCLGYEVPMCLKLIMWKSGYDSLLSVKQMCEENILKVEKYVQKNRTKILPLLDDKIDTVEYKKQKIFEFLPGHRCILMDLPKSIKKMQSELLANDMIYDMTHTVENMDCGNNDMSTEYLTEYSIILRELINTAKKNHKKSKHGYQYNDTIKYFSTYIFLLCGRTCYETLNKNLPIPSTKTILRCINDTKRCILEGNLRCEELHNYLLERNGGKDIWLCEDGSGIISKIQYDQMMDQLVGMVLPIDAHTGCPKRYEFTARDEEEIKKFMQHSKSTLVYIVMAIPLKEGVAPFILQMFGTDNRFKAIDVIKRWNFTIQELKRVHGVSSDGDPRLLAAMRHQMHYEPDGIFFMQDVIHSVLKFRNRMLRFYDELPLGTKQVSAAHLKVLIKEVPKLVHGLVYFDICPDDRQNFKSLTKSMDVRVLNALRDFVPDSEATVFYLHLCSEIVTSLMDHDITPHQRIEKIFHVIYFLRIWKKWVESSGYSSKNFITVNAYMCIEVTAANLLKLVRRFRDEEKPELFLTTLFDSQACERAFRQFRAMGTPNFTKVNFTLYELLHMTRRYEVQNDILYNKLPNVKLPKLEKSREKTKVYALPSEQEIVQCLNRAKRFALDDASKFGIQIASNEIDNCESKIPKNLVIEEEEEENDIDFNDDYAQIDFMEADLLDDDGQGDFPENAATVPYGFLKIRDPVNSSKEITMSKSTFVWHLTEGTKKISSDRLIRVQNSSSNTDHTSQQLGGESADPLSVQHKKVNVFQNIRIGDWCVFKNDKNDGAGKIYIGLILAFKFAKGRIANEKRYKGDMADVREHHSSAKELEVLSSWYAINDKGHLIPSKNENHFFINIENYLATVLKPLIDPDTKMLYFNANDFKEIEKDILSIISND